jgi:hypothetical protein
VLDAFVAIQAFDFFSRKNILKSAYYYINLQVRKAEIYMEASWQSPESRWLISPPQWVGWTTVKDTIQNTYYDYVVKISKISSSKEDF